MTICFLYVSCSSVPPLPPVHGGQREFRGEGGGGAKRRQFPRGGGFITEVFFQGICVRLVSYL